jgi:hypothetical protein
VRGSSPLAGLGRISQHQPQRARLAELAIAADGPVAVDRCPPGAGGSAAALLRAVHLPDRISNALRRTALAFLLPKIGRFGARPARYNPSRLGGGVEEATLGKTPGGCRLSRVTFLRSDRFQKLFCRLSSLIEGHQPHAAACRDGFHCARLRLGSAIIPARVRGITRASVKVLLDCSPISLTPPNVTALSSRMCEVAFAAVGGTGET